MLRTKSAYCCNLYYNENKSIKNLRIVLEFKLKVNTIKILANKFVTFYLQSITILLFLRVTKIKFIVKGN